MFHKFCFILLNNHLILKRELNMRKIAVNGFLQILNSDSSEKQSSSYSASNQSIELEILGFLRRSLSQQYEIRKTLYEGFLEVARNKIYLRDTIFSILHSQVCIKKYFL